MVLCAKISGMQLRSKINEQLFKKIHLGSLVYNTCWEDPRCDRAMLQLNETSKVVMLTSAGCNALDYLLDQPEMIHCVDVNPHQNALLHLKSALISGTDHATLFDFFGNGIARQRREVFADVVADRLPEHFSNRFWRNKLHYFSGKGIRKSFYWHGSSGAVAWSIRQWLHAHPTLLNSCRKMFETDSIEQQQEWYARVEPLFLNRYMRWAVKQHVVQSMLGVPVSQQILAKKYFEDGMAGYLRHCLRHVFTQLSLHDNYFWKLYFFGHYTPDCCPNYLQKSNFNTLQQHIGRVKTHTATLSDFLVRTPDQYSHFVLLDHQDWLAAHLKPELEREWKLIFENAAPKAKVLLRSASFEPDFLPDFVRERITFDQGAAQLSQQQDRVGTYAGTWIGTIN
jgi:S-adenosylmethionine-diacylglycerol 3-amino-3-carboxypropyl transferase